MSEVWVPRNYQLTSVSFLISNPASGLLLDPGLGKTATSLAAIKILLNSGQTRGVLMVAPLRVCYLVWPPEIAKWSQFNGLTHTILHGGNKDSLFGPQRNVYLINPEGLPWLYKELLEGLKAGKQCPFDTLWIDESTKFKSHNAKARFELIKDMLPLFKRRHIMTGTPAPNSLLDMWSQVYILDEGKSLTDNYYHYRKRYFETDNWNKYNWNLKEGASKKIHEAIAPLLLEMSAEDHLDLPPLVYNDILIELPEKTLKQYKKMEKDFFAELDDGTVTASAVAQKSMKCRQLATGAIYEDIPEDLDKDAKREFMKRRKTFIVHNEKISALKGLVEELNGKPLLIAYHYRHELKALKKLFGSDVAHIGSGVSEAEMLRIQDSWNAGKEPILLGHPASMGHGLNLQGSGNDVCWYGPTWSLEEYLQFIRRVYRSGVSGVVRVHHLIVKKTLEQAMLPRLGERAKEQSGMRAGIKYYRDNLA